MEGLKNEIIDSLYKVMCTATTTAVDSKVQNNDYFKRRILGFKAEMEFENLVNDRKFNIKYLEGGQFISKRLSGIEDDKNSFIYTTVSLDDEGDYVDLYSKISIWSQVSKLIFIKIVNTPWERSDFEVNNGEGKLITQILKPAYKFYIFDKLTKSFINSNLGFSEILDSFEIPNKKSNVFKLRKKDQFDYFSNYNIELLKKIYANRYFIDVILRSAKGRQLIDLDGIIIKNDKMHIVEIKEKIPLKNNSELNNMWTYGWDTRRLLWYLYIQLNLKINVIYNVRQVTSREDRNFVQWDSINMDEFLKGVSWSNSRSGGGGEDTLQCPYLFFKRLELLIDSL